MGQKKTKIGQPIRAVQLTIWMTPLASGKVQMNTTIKYKCKDKPTAIELIKEYVNKNERTGKVEA